MFKLSELKPYKRATKRAKLVGRGLGSGHGTFSGRGAKGQKARSGASMPVGFEGGRMPLHRQIPKKRGFKSHSPKAVVVNLTLLDQKFSNGDTINPRVLFDKSITKSAQAKVKILGSGEIKKSLIIEKISVSASAKEKIEKAGGKIIS